MIRLDDVVVAAVAVGAVDEDAEDARNDAELEAAVVFEVAAAAAWVLPFLCCSWRIPFVVPGAVRGRSEHPAQTVQYGLLTFPGSTVFLVLNHYLFTYNSTIDHL